MKRTRKIDLDRMRKRARPVAMLRPVALAVAAAVIAGCDSSSGYRQAEIFRDVAECEQRYPAMMSECRSAYQAALKESASSGPKYGQLEDCVAEFGENNCVPYRQSHTQTWFMPALAGFLFGQALGSGPYRGAPLYTSYVRTSPFYGGFTYSDGSILGPTTYGRTSVPASAYNPKPAVTRTISRGGFGSTVVAKSQASAKAAAARRSSSSSSRSSGRSWGG